MTEDPAPPGRPLVNQARLAVWLRKQARPAVWLRKQARPAVWLRKQARHGAPVAASRPATGLCDPGSRPEKARS